MAAFDAAPMGADDTNSGVVGNVARGSKAATGPGHDLTDFSVRKGDNGGIVVSEVYKPKLPAGRRPSAGFPALPKIKENPFSAKDGASALDHITGLLGQMGVKAAAPTPPEEEPDEGTPDEENAPDEGDEGADTGAPPLPPAGAAAGPMGAPPPMPPVQKPGL